MGPSMTALSIIPIPFRDEILPGDSLPDKLLSALKRSKLRLKAGDILVIKHKIVSKAEGQLINLDGVKPSRASRAWARRYKLDARVTNLPYSKVFALSAEEGEF